MKNNFETDSTSENKALIIFSAIFTLVLAWAAFRVWSISDQTKSAWDELTNISEAHRVLVPAYTNCRNGISGRSEEECQLVVKDYSELKNLKEQLPKVLEDITSLSRAIKEEHH